MHLHIDAPLKTELPNYARMQSRPDSCRLFVCTPIYVYISSLCEPSCENHQILTWT